MKNRFGLTGRLFIITMLALAMVFTITGLGSSMPAKPVLAGDNGLRSGYLTVRHWNSTITGAAPTPTPLPAQAGSCDWTGDWNTNWAGMHLTQTGGWVSGTYGLLGERIEGTVSGNTLVGTWSEPPSYSPPTDAGEVEFTISADCNSFTGQWRYGYEGDWDGIWTGTRVGAAPPTVDSDGDGVPDGNDQCPGTPAGVAVDASGCPAQGLNVTISADKTEYSAGETAVIRGSVSDVSGTVAGAGITVDVSGWKGSATTDAAGNYRVQFPIPANVGQPSYVATATASHNGKTGISPSVILSVGQVGLIVTMTTDKDHYLIGDPVYCTITVKDPKGEVVPYAKLSGTAKHLSSGRTTELSGSTNPMGENNWNFTWGQDNSGQTIAEGKLQIDITASKDNAEGKTTVIICGCGDLEKAEVEDCLDCPEDCPCDPEEVCDPSSISKDPKTMCSPKIAYIFISNNLSSYEEWFISNKIKYARKLLRKLGYRVRPNIHVGHIDDIAKYLSRPSTKAIAYFGHGEEPGGIPTIEAAEATKGDYPIKEAITIRSKEYGGFLYTCQYETYAAKWVESKDKIEKIAQDKADHPNLENAYIFACYSLDDYSLRDYLLESGGTYWGYRGKLPGNASLIKTNKPIR